MNGGTTKRVYYDQNGCMQFGQKYIEENWYYFNPGSGEMRTGFVNIPKQMNGGTTKRVYYDQNGCMQFGQKYIGGNWYYFHPGNGKMSTGFVNIPKQMNGGTTKRVYYNQNGCMQFGQKYIGKNWYYFNPGNGKMSTGFVNIPKQMNGGTTKRVYYNQNGCMQFGQKYIGKNWYYFNPGNGKMSTGFVNIPKEWNSGIAKRVYYDKNGHMLYGLNTIGKDIYYFDTASGQIYVGYKSFGNNVRYFQKDGRCFVGTGNTDKAYLKTDSQGNIKTIQTLNVPFYMQSDPRWAWNYIGGYDFRSTGCVPTCMTSIINYYKGTNYTPIQVGNLLYKNGLFNNPRFGAGAGGDAWKFMTKYYGLGFQNNMSKNDIVMALKQGKLVGALVDSSYYNHYGYTHQILLTGYREDGKVYVHDPLWGYIDGWRSLDEIIAYRSHTWVDNLEGGPFFAV